MIWLDSAGSPRIPPSRANQPDPPDRPGLCDRHRRIGPVLPATLNSSIEGDTILPVATRSVAPS
jgi:hypothetical protein